MNPVKVLAALNILGDVEVLKAIIGLIGGQILDVTVELRLEVRFANKPAAVAGTIQIMRKSFLVVWQRIAHAKGAVCS